MSSSNNFSIDLSSNKGSDTDIPNSDLDINFSEINSGSIQESNFELSSFELDGSPTENQEVPILSTQNSPSKNVPTESVSDLFEDEFSLMTQDKDIIDENITQNESIMPKSPEIESASKIDQMTPETEQSTPGIPPTPENPHNENNTNEEPVTRTSSSYSNSQKSSSSSYSNSQKIVPNIKFDFTPKATNPILTKPSNFDNFDTSELKSKIQKSKIKKHAHFEKYSKFKSKIETVQDSHKKVFSKFANNEKISNNEAQMLKNCLKMFSNQVKKKGNSVKMPDFEKTADQMEFHEKMRELEISRLAKKVSHGNDKQLKCLEDSKEKVSKLSETLVISEKCNERLEALKSRSKKLNEDVLDVDIIERWNYEISFLDESQLKEVKVLFENDPENDLLKNKVDTCKLLCEIARNREKNIKKQLEESEANLKEVKEGLVRQSLQQKWKERFEGLLEGLDKKIKK